MHAHSESILAPWSYPACYYQPYIRRALIFPCLEFSHGTPYQRRIHVSSYTVSQHPSRVLVPVMMLPPVCRTNSRLERYRSDQYVKGGWTRSFSIDLGSVDLLAPVMPLSITPCRQFNTTAPDLRLHMGHYAMAPCKSLDLSIAVQSYQIIRGFKPQDPPKILVQVQKEAMNFPFLSHRRRCAFLYIYRFSLPLFFFHLLNNLSTIALWAPQFEVSSCCALTLRLPTQSAVILKGFNHSLAELYAVIF